ncbi:conserved alanine and leucine rich protein [Mycobacteroides abscessus subsp. abscessus]|nr:conserved alanine and leucine rich protein [Mycobacteroides abscessus subsp. abscessus]
MSRRLLDEPLALSGGQSWWGGIDTERSHLLANLASLLVKSTAGEEVYTGPLESAQTLETLRARIEAQPWRWVGQELPELSVAPGWGATESARRIWSGCYRSLANASTSIGTGNSWRPANVFRCC